MLMTFFVAAVQEQWQTDTGLSGAFWAVLGVTSLFSGPVFGAMSDKIGRYQTLAMLFALQALAHGLIALGAPLAWIMLSAGVFGLSTWAVPSIMATLSSELFGMANTARVLSLITIFFGIGQIVGPLMAGIMRDITGSFTLAFTVSTGLLCFAVLTALAASRTGRKNR
jgi:MFS family permease